MIIAATVSTTLANFFYTLFYTLLMYQVGVLLPRPWSHPYTYLHSAHLAPGTTVLVELRSKRVWGVVDSCVASITASKDQLKCSAASKDQLRCSTENSQLKHVLSVGPTIGQHTLAWLKLEAQENFVPVGTILELALQRNINYTPPASPQYSQHTTPTNLTPDQTAAVQDITNADRTLLLRGATGSGKTEVYFEAIHNALSKGQVLILLPEISLTKEWRARFRSRFGFDAYVWHSKVARASKTKTWNWAVSGRAGVVVGARSAVFLPLSNLQMIVLDEEHDQSYKQESTPRYHARDVAVRRANACNARLVLVSATPSLETVHAVAEKKYCCTQLSRLPQHGLATLRICSPGTPLSESLIAKILENARGGGASLLLVNRRGYASGISCGPCRRKLVCSRCSVGLAWHNSGLKCHWCGISRPLPSACKCGAQAWRPYGWGLERIADWIQTQYPTLRVGCASSDTKDVCTVLNRLQAGELDLVVGTQVISQGHNIPNVSLVAMLDATHSGDFRSYERLFQLITQTRGRAGRAMVAGEAWWETEHTNNHVAKYIDYPDRFYAIELRNRQAAEMPPFSKLIAIIVLSKTNTDAKRVALAIAELRTTGITLWGPAPAPILKIRNTYRWRILVTGNREKLFEIANSARKLATRAVSIEVDQSPYSFY